MLTEIIMHHHLDLVISTMRMSYPQNGCWSSWYMYIITVVYLLIIPFLEKPINVNFWNMYILTEFCFKPGQNGKKKTIFFFLKSCHCDSRMQTYFLEKSKEVVLQGWLLNSWQVYAYASDPTFYMESYSWEIHVAWLRSGTKWSRELIRTKFYIIVVLF